jgi:hypothetical protein
MVDIIMGLGGLKAIAISHPHYYTTRVEWRRAFGDIPIYLHNADSECIMRFDSCIQLWDGEQGDCFGHDTDPHRRPL